MSVSLAIRGMPRLLHNFSLHASEKNELVQGNIFPLLEQMHTPREMYDNELDTQISRIK